MVKKNSKLHGVLPVLQTPFHEDESIDWPTLEREIAWVFEKKADGIVLGMVSEILRLSHGERQMLTEKARQFTGNRGQVIVSVGAESGKVAEELARHAEGAGADGVMAAPPISSGASEEELFRYYQRIVGAIAIPVVVQDASSYVGRPLSIPLYDKLLKEFGDLRVYFKPEASPIGPRLSALRDATGGSARVFEGTGGVALVDSYRRGIVGTMPGTDLLRAIVALWKALENNDEQAVYRINGPLCGLLSLENSLDTFIAIEKYLLVKQGVFHNKRVRGPVGYILDRETAAEVDRLFEILIQAVPA